jgi:hypothetical protein
VVVAVRPVMLLAKVPLPVPSVVLVARAIVGFAVVLQQTPRAVIVAPPLSVMFPPLVAVVDVIDVTAVVVRVGKVATIFSGLISFWQLKVIMANRIMQRKVFMFSI